MRCPSHLDATFGPMRTTVTFAPDVAAAIEHRRQETGEGLSEAVNDLVRAGLIAPKRRKKFVQKTYPIGVGNVDNIAEAIERLEGPDWK